MGREDDEEEAERSGVKGCTCPKDRDNDDGELFAIAWAVALAYEDNQAAVPMILSVGLMVHDTGSGDCMDCQPSAPTGLQVLGERG